MQYTEEQKKDIETRATEADKLIKEILEKYELSVVALPAFQEIENGRCVAVGILQYRDVKFLKEPVIETEEDKKRQAVN